MLWNKQNREAAREKEAEKSERRDEATQRHQDSVNNTSAILGILKYLRTKEERQQTAKTNNRAVDTARKWLSLAAIFIAAAFAAGQWISMRGQQKIMQGQLDEMQFEQRAWVSVTKDSGMEDFFINATGELRGTIKTTLQNTGKNPAVGVFVNAEMSVGAVIPHGSMLAWQAAICAQSTGPLGATMFPGSPEPVFLTETGLAAVELDDRIGSTTNGSAVLAPVIAGCIAYEDAVTRHVHHTPIAYEIRMRVPRPGRNCCAITSGDLPLKEEDIVLRPWVRGNLPPN